MIIVVIAHYRRRGCADNCLLPVVIVVIVPAGVEDGSIPPRSERIKGKSPGCSCRAGKALLRRRSGRTALDMGWGGIARQIASNATGVRAENRYPRPSGRGYLF
jgi:hypothetical protein